MSILIDGLRASCRLASLKNAKIDDPPAATAATDDSAGKAAAQPNRKRNKKETTGTSTTIKRGRSGSDSDDSNSATTSAGDADLTNYGDTSGSGMIEGANDDAEKSLNRQQKRAKERKIAAAARKKEKTGRMAAGQDDTKTAVLREEEAKLDDKKDPIGNPMHVLGAKVVAALERKNVHDRRAHCHAAIMSLINHNRIGRQKEEASVKGDFIEGTNILTYAGSHKKALQISHKVKCKKATKILPVKGGKGRLLLLIECDSLLAAAEIVADGIENVM